MSRVSRTCHISSSQEPRVAGWWLPCLARPAWTCPSQKAVDGRWLLRASHCIVHRQDFVSWGCELAPPQAGTPAPPGVPFEEAPESS